MPERPYIGGDGLDLGGGQLRSTHRRHRRPVLLRLRYAGRDRMRDRSETAVSPQPVATGQIRPMRRALAVAPMTAFTWSVGDRAVENLAAECNLRRGCSGRSGKRSNPHRLRTRIRMDAFWRESGL